MVYKVWVHPKRGSDYYYSFTSLSKAVAFSKRNPRAELPLIAKGRGALNTREYAISKERLIRASKRKKTKPKQRQIINFGFNPM